MAKLDVKFNLLMTVADDEALTELSRRLQLPRAEILRQLIRWRSSMQLRAIPICANGRPCMVPHLHQMPGTQASIVPAPQGAAIENSIYPTAEETFHG